MAGSKNFWAGFLLVSINSIKFELTISNNLAMNPATIKKLSRLGLTVEITPWASGKGIYIKLIDPTFRTSIIDPWVLSAAEATPTELNQVINSMIEVVQLNAFKKTPKQKLKHKSEGIKEIQEALALVEES